MLMALGSSVELPGRQRFFWLHRRNGNADLRNFQEIENVAHAHHDPVDPVVEKIGGDGGRADTLDHGVAHSIALEMLANKMIVGVHVEFLFNFYGMLAAGIAGTHHRQSAFPGRSASGDDEWREAADQRHGRQPMIMRQVCRSLTCM